MTPRALDRRYWKRLAGWARVRVPPGGDGVKEAVAVIAVERGTLKFHDGAMARRLVAGEYTFTAGQTHLDDDFPAAVALA